VSNPQSSAQGDVAGEPAGARKEALRKSAVRFTIAVAVLAACGPASQPGIGPDVRRELDHGADAATTWITRARTGSRIDETTAIATGYLERLRLGLGSPFRLIEIALNDTRLPDTVRTRLAWAMLARTRSRNTYQIEPVALDRIGLHRRSASPGSGRLHLDLIDGAIRQSTDPRSGELAVRLAYMLAAAAGDLGNGAPDVAARAAALIRDRELARTDVIRLLRESSDSSANPLDLVARWRAERRFEVEHPPMQALTSESELNAMQYAPLLANALHDLAAREPSVVQSVAQPGTASLLGRLAALRLEAAADSSAFPPATPIAISVLLHADELIQSPWIARTEKEQREHFVGNAASEESFAAGLAQLRRGSAYDAGPAVIALAAAVAMRSSAQEAVWLPGLTGPSVRELQERYGLASVTFGDDVPAEWRPYFRRLIDSSLSDLRLVLPALDLRGLNVHFTDEGRQEATLALHDPRNRRLVLPPLTGAGTLAHEIAHDLDWQIALSRYRVRGDYASDRAVRLSTGDRFSVKLQNLADNSFELSGTPERTSHANRPAEVFARNMDWFVAASLAAKGRIDGYLSSVQDDMLTGYGSVRPPDISGNAGNALISILDDVAPLYPETREWFVKHYGRARSLTPYDLMRRVLESSPADAATDLAMSAWPGEARFESVERARDAGFAAIDAWVCNTPGATFFRDYEAARRELVLTAAKARARGIALQLIRSIGGRTAEEWSARRLESQRGAFDDSPDDATVDAITPIIERARQAGTAELPSTAIRIGLQSPPADCATGPLRITNLF
jgi:hypothetical protein